VRLGLSKASQIRQKAQEYLRKGNIDKAIEEYRRLVGVESKNPNLFNELGDMFLRAGDKVQAVANYEKAIRNYENVALYNNAVAVCKKILRIIPDRRDTLFKLGEIRAKQKLEGEAINYFSRFMDKVLAEAGADLEGVPDKLDRAIEYCPENEMILSKAAEVFNFYGLKKKAAEIYTKLASKYRRLNDGDRERFYNEKYEQIKKDLTVDELKAVEEVLAGSREETVPTAEAEACVEEEKTGNVEEAEAGSQGGESSEEPVERESRPIDDVAEEEELISTMQVGEVNNETQPIESEGVGREEDPGIQETIESVEDDAGGPFSSKIEGIEGKPSGESGGESGVNLVEEITSDVEEEDYKSHYDLGMAYLEMGLYTEAIKEFQLASRSEQLNLKCYEMIGHCFIKQNNARLAVKQLNRALEFARRNNLDPIGIHYNLGVAYEMLGEKEKAREHFEEVYIVDMGFRDITDKMKKYSGSVT